MLQPLLIMISLKTDFHSNMNALDHILEIRRHWPLSFFPLVRYTKKPYKGFKWDIYQQRFPRPEEINLWSRQHPTCNIAVVTGAISGIIILDVDGPAGRESLRGYPIPPTVTVLTARGEHYWFQYPNIHFGNGCRIAPGLDIRGDGGYVAAAGSIHESGFHYQWKPDPNSPPDSGQLLSPITIRPAPLPVWLTEMIHTRQQQSEEPTSVSQPSLYAQAALTAEVRRIRSLPKAEGSRKNDHLNCSAFRMGQLIGADLIGEKDVIDALLTAWIDLDKPEKQGLATIRSGIAAGRKQPRRIEHRTQYGAHE